MMETRKLEASIIIDVPVEGGAEEDWDEECMEDALTERHSEPYKMERWRTEHELEAVFDFCGTTRKAIAEIFDMTDDLPWFWQEPLLHCYVARHASNHRKKLREAFQRADIGAQKLAEAIRQSDLRPPISDWKSFFQSADAWKKTLQGLSAEHVITLWNYYLIESAYVFDFDREWHCQYVLAHCDEDGIDKFLRGWPPSKILNALWYAEECSLRLRSAPDAMWFTMDDKTLEDALHGGTLEEAAAFVVDMKILSGYLAMRALDLDTILELARDATSSFEKDMPHLEIKRRPAGNL